MDDSARVVEGVRRFLGRHPQFTVGTACSGPQALAMVAQLESDLVLIDLHMPGIDGFATATLVRERHPLVRIIMMSMKQDARVQAECVRRGADGFLPKIGLQRKLLAEIQRLFPNHNI